MRSISAKSSMLFPRDFRLSVGFGLLGAAWGRVSGLGVNPDIDTGTLPEDVHYLGGIYPWMTGATFLEIVTGASDVATGIGARSVSIRGLDATFVEVVQTVALSSTVTAVPLPLYRINAARVLSVGNNWTNVADVLIRDAGGGTSRAVIPAGLGVLRQTQYTVPAGFSLQVTEQFLGISRATSAAFASVTPYVKTDGLAYLLSAEFPLTESSPITLYASPGPLLPEKTDFGYRCTYVGTNNTSVVGMWNGTLHKNGTT